MRIYSAPVGKGQLGQNKVGHEETRYVLWLAAKKNHIADGPLTLDTIPPMVPRLQELEESVPVP